MKSNRLIKILIATTFVAAGTASADSTSDARIQMIQISANGTVRFQLDRPMCGLGANGGSTFFGDVQVGQLGVTTDAQKAMLSTLMSAKLSASPVKIFAQNGAALSFGCAVFAVEIR